MESKRQWRDEGPPAPPDENWWEAVLAEEENYGKSNTGAKPAKDSDHLVDVDWEFTNQLYSQETILDYEVKDYNRGGLLVTGNNLSGFVPVSHLMEMDPEMDDAQREHMLSSYLGRSLCLKVIECDEQRGRVVLSERAGLGEPGCREELFRTLKTGETIMGAVTNVTNFGVFVDLGGVEGLVHVSELSWGRVRHPVDVLKMGEEVNLLVLQIDSERGRVALSLKRLMSNPWEQAHQRYQIGDVREAVVTSIVRFGAFACLEEGLEGLIHVSEMGIKGHVKPWLVLQEGQQVMVRVLHVDSDHQRLGLSLETSLTGEENAESESAA